MGAVPPKSKRKPVEEVLEDTSPEVTSWRKGSQVLWNQVELVIQTRYSQGHSRTLFQCSRDSENMSTRSIFRWEFQSALLMEPWNQRITGHHLTISGSQNLKVTWGWCWSQDSHHQHHQLIQPFGSFGPKKRVWYREILWYWPGIRAAGCHVLSPTAAGFMGCWVAACGDGGGRGTCKQLQCLCLGDTEKQKQQKAAASRT